MDLDYADDAALLSELLHIITVGLGVIGPTIRYGTSYNIRRAAARKLTVNQLNLPQGTNNRKRKELKQLEMWADAQRDGRPAEYRWRPLRKFRNSIPCTTPQSLANARCWSAVQ